MAQGHTRRSHLPSPTETSGGRARRPGREGPVLFKGLVAKNLFDVLLARFVVLVFPAVPGRGVIGKPGFPFLPQLDSPTPPVA